MKFDKLKPDLQNLNLAGVKKAASRAARVRVKLSRRQWIAIACAAIVAGVLLVVLLRPRPASVTLPVVAVEPVETEDVNIYGDYVGRIRAQQFVEIRARVEGYLEKMLFAEGTYIKKGQTLFVIDPLVYRARVDKAKAQLNKARAQALKAKRDLDRIRPLFEQSAASQLELDNATAAYESAVADVAVVSAANESAIASEWKRYGLARHADVIFGQEVGSKANSIATMLACGYESRKVMMVGDAMGDAQAAAANGVAFVPILPGREADSWRRLQEEALPKLLHGTFSPAYQAELLAALRSALHG